MFLADNGSSWFLSGAPDDRWDNDDLHELQERIHGSDFEAVDCSSLVARSRLWPGRLSDRDAAGRASLLRSVRYWGATSQSPQLVRTEHGIRKRSSAYRAPSSLGLLNARGDEFRVVPTRGETPLVVQQCCTWSRR